MYYDPHTPANAINDLLKLADPRRMSRAANRHVATFNFDGDTFEAAVPGNEGRVYTARIYTIPRAYSCSCLDHAHNGRAGPCKHLIALALEVQYDLDTIEALQSEPRD